MKHVITVDGYVASGKGTLSTAIARRLGWLYLDSGSIYRAYSYYLLQHDISSRDETYLVALFSEVTISFVYNAATDHNDICLNGDPIESYIRNTYVSKNIASFVALPAIRRHVVAVEREIAGDHSIVIDGRDGGTVVFPDAPLKVFVVADTEVRIHRRLAQLHEQNMQATYDDVAQDIRMRDYKDYTGPDAVNYAAPDALLLDTTSLSIDQAVETVLEWADDRGLLSFVVHT